MWLKRWISIYVSWEQLHTNILRDKLNCGRKAKITYRREYDTHKWARGGGKDDLSHFQNHSLMTRSPSINSQDRIQVMFMTLGSPSSLNHHFCDAKDPQRNRLTSNPATLIGLPLPTQNSRTLHKPRVSSLRLARSLDTGGRSINTWPPACVYNIHKVVWFLLTLCFAPSLLWAIPSTRTQFYSS